MYFKTVSLTATQFFNFDGNKANSFTIMLLMKINVVHVFFLNSLILNFKITYMYKKKRIKFIYVHAQTKFLTTFLLSSFYEYYKNDIY